MKTLVSKLEETKQQIEREAKLKSQEVARLQAELKQTTDTQNQNISKTDQQIAALRNKVKLMEKELKERTEEAESLRKFLTSTKSELESTQNSLKKQTEELFNLANSQRNSRIEFTKTKTELQEKAQRSSSLENELNTASRNASEIFKVFQQLRLVLNPNASSDSTFSGDELDFGNRLGHELSSLRELFLSAYRDVEQLVQDRNRFQCETSQLEKVLNEKKNCISALTANLDALQKENEALHDSGDKFATERQSLGEAVMKMRQSLELLKDKLRESESENKQLKDKSTALEVLLHKIQMRCP
jgi:chromosome segregation ATPase